MIKASSDDKEPRDAISWARLSSALRVSRVPTGALDLNVDGRKVVGPLQGFGQLWQKTYRLNLSDVSMTLAEIMLIWKTNFTQFQIATNQFYPGAGIVEPGQILLINASMKGMPVYTGVMVLYSDDESFTLITPEGHPESGWVTFSVFTDDEGGTVCQIQSLARANDPLYELGFRLFASDVQERIWIHVLKSLATYLHAPEKVQVSKACLDPQIQWSEAKNIWHNAAVRTTFYTCGVPIRWLVRLFHRVAHRRK